MDIIYADQLKNHLQENFPHLVRVWGRETWDSFISSRSAKALEVFTYLSGNTKSLRDRQTRIVLFEGLISSPYQLVADTVRQEFPRFQHRLSMLDHSSRQNILIELTLSIWPVNILASVSNTGNKQLGSPSEVAQGIGCYLHQMLRSASK